MQHHPTYMRLDVNDAVQTNDPAARLRAWRARESLSLADAAEQLGCTRQAVHALETGQTRNPELPLGLAIRDTAKIPVELWIADDRP